MQVTKLTEDATTITLGWTPVAGATGYRFSTSLSNKKPHTWDPLIRRDMSFPSCNTKFSKGATWYKIEALGVSDVGTYPPPSPVVLYPSKTLYPAEVSS